MNSTVKKIRVEGMKCEGCAKNVRCALEAVPNVAKVAVNLEKHVAEVYCDQNNPPSNAQLKEAIAKLGFEVVGID
jgi:copper chaperone CopZ